MNSTNSNGNNGRLYQRHKRTPSIPLRVRSIPLTGDAQLSTTLLSPSNADLPPAEPFRSTSGAATSTSGAASRHAHAALPQKASEKYGFVIYVGSLIAWYLFLFWSFTPDRFIKAIGIEWYPNRCVAMYCPTVTGYTDCFCVCREWALLVPSWIMVTVIYVYIAYFALNLYHTPALSSMASVTDTQGKVHPKLKEVDRKLEAESPIYPPYSIRHKMEGYEDDYIPPLYDLPVSLMNQAVFGGGGKQEPGQ